MIIDKILDRMDGEPYSSKQFYNDCMEYGTIGHGIARAMDSGTEQDVKREIKRYLFENDYLRQEIYAFVDSKKWIKETNMKAKAEREQGDRL